MNSSLRAVTKFFPTQRIDAYLVTNDTDIRYLTDFPASESWLLVFPNQAVYLTDFRYTQEAKQGLKGVVVKQYQESLHQLLFELLKAKKVKRLGFDDRHFSLAGFKKLKSACPKSIQLVAADPWVGDLRMVKRAEEIQKIEQALRIHQQALKFLRPLIRPGMSEVELLKRLTRFVQDQGMTFSFNPIIASGANSALPHAKVTDRKFRRNDVVLVDMGIDYQGYKSDLTRIFVLGKISSRFKNVYAAVEEAQAAAIADIRPGKKCSEIDQLARKILESKGLAKYFGHSLGHGVGLEIHEDPRLSAKCSTVLKEGMVVTVEPGVYLPQQFGIRLEEMVLVTKDGCRVLSRSII